MSKKRVNTSNKPTAETLAEVTRRIRAAPGEEDSAQGLTPIGAAYLKQFAPVFARLAVTYYDDAGSPHPNPMGDYDPVNTQTQYNLVAAQVPEGSVVSFWLDVSASSQNAPYNRLFRFRTNAPDQPCFISTGPAGNVILDLEGMIPAPPVMKRPLWKK